MFKRIRPLVIVNFVVLYVFASYGWWSILLLKKNEETFQTKVNLLQEQITPASPEYLSDYIQLKKRYEAERLMIISEGTVYMVLLVLGAWQIRHSFRKEMDLNKQQRNFLLSITHELKSPLASTKASLQTLSLHKDLAADQTDKLLKNSMEDMERLQKLVENILFASKVEDEKYKLPVEQVNLSQLAEEVYSKFSAEYGKKRKLTATIDNGITLQGNQMALSSAILNLLENAVKYSEEGTSIILEVKRLQNVVHIVVNDEGVGVTDEEKRKIFLKFYRSGSEETRRTKGTGLGLFIVDKIAKMYGGNISVSNNVPKGSIFEITLPIN